MIGPAGFMAAPAQQERAEPPVWGVEACQTYVHRDYWSVWRAQANVYGGRAYLMNASRTDRKRFYDEAKAKAAADALNRKVAGQAGDAAGGDRG